VSGSIMAFVAERGITEVLHFTTNHGLVGILASGALLSRDDLNAEDLLGSVRLLNCKIRRDPEWTGYVNMSISAVNNMMLSTSRGWHPLGDIWWAVLSFGPEILDDEGVVFTTTNNVYDDVVKRSSGIDGLRAMYGERIPYGYYGSAVPRFKSTPPDRPTHVQAEVLYPGRVDLSRLRAIYVPMDQHLDEIEGLMTSIPGAPRVPVSVRPEVFR
jgi:hypothetical protein